MRLIDLAGSERVGKSDATGQVFTEGTFINQALGNLGEVIKKASALATHTRASVLRHALL